MCLKFRARVVSNAGFELQFLMFAIYIYIYINSNFINTIHLSQFEIKKHAYKIRIILKINYIYDTE